MVMFLRRALAAEEAATWSEGMEGTVDTGAMATTRGSTREGTDLEAMAGESIEGDQGGMSTIMCAAVTAIGITMITTIITTITITTTEYGSY